MTGYHDDLRKQCLSNKFLKAIPTRFPQKIPFLKVSLLAIHIMAGAIIYSSFHVDPVNDPRAVAAPEPVDLKPVDPKPKPHPAQFDDGIDWSDSIFDRHGWDNDPIVVESHKLLFFTIPKNSCTTFKKLFRRMMGYPNWLDGDPHNPETNGLRYLGHYSREQQKEFMTSPNWTRAVFVRDPLERALSAYMDKGLHTYQKWQPPVAGAYLKRYCCQSWKAKKNPACKAFPLVPYENSLTVDNFPFEVFVTSFLRQCEDVHWKQQSLRLRNENWKWINFVGHFESIRDDTRRLLEQIGAYEEFGATGWGQWKNKSLSIFETNLESHKTGSGNKMKEHYSPKIERLVLEYYRQDYSSELFNLTKPANYTHELFGRKTPNRNRSSADTNSGNSVEARKFTPELIH